MNQKEFFNGYSRSHPCWAPVVHTCNPSYSGGRDQEDLSLKPARANSLQDPVSKNPITKNWAGGVAQGKDPEFKPQYHKKSHPLLIRKILSR
jgi:hypothetical protein